jgi:phosphoglycerate-specific signal transduction histidine kinase
MNKKYLKYTLITTLILTVCIYFFIDYKYEKLYENKNTKNLQLVIDSLEVQQKKYSKEIDSLSEVNRYYKKNDSLLRIQIKSQENKSKKILQEVKEEKRKIIKLKMKLSRISDSLNNSKTDPLKLIISTKKKLKKIQKNK